MSNIELGVAPDWAQRAREILGERGSRARAVLPDPEDDSWWFRDFEAAGSCDDTGLSPFGTVHEAEKHFSILEQTKDIGVPPRSYYIDSHGYPTPPGALMRVRAMRSGFELDTDDLLEIPEIFVQPLQAVRRGLQKYYHWIRKTNQPYFLDDIAGSRQYMYGRLGYHLENSVQLIDVEPRLNLVDSTAWWHQQIEFYDWAIRI